MSHPVLNLQMFIHYQLLLQLVSSQFETTQGLPTYSEYLYDSMSFICHGQTHCISDEESDRRLESFLENSEKHNSWSWKQTLKFVTQSYSIYA
jgi:hypothetical protein